jgi:putative flavoprotein involved in K+ transport
LMTGQVGEMSGTPERIETIVIGGGQSGLAVGYHLARQGRPFVILDANERIGDSWRKRWDSLRVFTPARLDGLPGMPFPAPASSFPAKDEVADYLVAYAARFDLRVRTGVRVDGLARFGDRFVVTSGDRRFEADNVVVAPGAYHNPRVPVFAPELDPAIVQMHSSEYRNPSQLQEGGVLVVGAGNSGAEIALEASRGHQTWLSGRDTGHEPVRAGSGPDKLVTPLMWFVATHVLTVRTPVGQKVQRMFRSRGIPLARVRRKDLTAAGVELVPRTAGVLDGSPVLEDGRVLDVANVIWCTGFAPDLTWINLPVFNEDGDPVHNRGVVESEPGLYFIGMYFLYALSSVLIGGVGRDAEHVATHMATRQPTGGPEARMPAGA